MPCLVSLLARPATTNPTIARLTPTLSHTVRHASAAAGGLVVALRGAVAFAEIVSLPSGFMTPPHPTHPPPNQPPPPTNPPQPP